MAVSDLVTILVEYQQSSRESFSELYGGEGLAAVQDIQDLLREELQEQTGLGALWADFEDDPAGMAEELSGQVEALIEADPGLGQELNQLLGEFKAADRSWKEEREAGEGLPKAFSPHLPGQQALEEPDPEDSRQGQVYEEKGAFRYGNQPPGEVTITGKLPTVPMSLDGDPQAEVELFFDQLRTTLDEKFELSQERKEELNQIFGAMEAEFHREEGAREQRLQEHIEQISELKPSLVRYLEDWLKGLLPGEDSPGEPNQQ
jgi:hypothetical protein